MSSINAGRIAAAITFAFAFSTATLAQGLSPAEDKAASQRIAAEAKSARAACKSLSGNAKNVCLVQADANESTAKADLEVRIDPGSKSRYDARVTRARADYTVAREKCSDAPVGIQDQCIRDAKAIEVGVKTDATAQRKVADAEETSRDAARTTRTKANPVDDEARDAAAEQKREAAFGAAIEKCFVYVGSAKESCMQQTKARFGKT
jgi:hypothetical protein